MLCEPAIITVRAAFGERAVAGWRLGDWAVHRQIDDPSRWAITWLPQGLSLPLAWASFVSRHQALAAMADIVRMKNRWDDIGQQDFTAALKFRLQRVCRRHGAVDGPLQATQPLDGPRTGFGLPLGTRINGRRSA